MNKLHLAALLPAIGVGLALPAFAADNTSQGTQGPAKMDQTDQARPDPASESGNTGQKIQPDAGKAKQLNQKQDKKHPPAAAMDSATPTEKSTATGNAAKHPPAATMDAATPVQKSPEVNPSGQSQGSSSTK